MARASKSRKVSVLIRTRDVEKHFFRLLRELSHQTLRPSEIIVVDNFSSERKLKDFKDALFNGREECFDNQIPIKLIPIRDDEFSHPYSTNIGVSAANSELICITNGHSLPTSNFWLVSGIRHFRNSGVAGVSGYYIPHEDGSIWEKLAYGLVRPMANEISDFSTVNCIIRKSVWKKYPFDENLPEMLPKTERYGGEDYDWAKEMMAKGYKIIMEPKFSAYHSHGLSLLEMIKINWKWFRIRREIDSFKRPREANTKLNVVGLGA